LGTRNENYVQKILAAFETLPLKSVIQILQAAIAAFKNAT